MRLIKIRAKNILELKILHALVWEMMEMGS